MGKVIYSPIKFVILAGVEYFKCGVFIKRNVNLYRVTADAVCLYINIGLVIFVQDKADRITDLDFVIAPPTAWFEPLGLVIPARVTFGSFER